MIVVTGGAGFIGSNLIEGLNARGETDLLLVDDLTDSAKIKNINDLAVADYLDKDEFIDKLERSNLVRDISYVFHLGACSDTMVGDGRFVMSVNYEYSKRLLAVCNASEIPMVYASSASVYGKEGPFSEDAKDCLPLNAYAYSKTLFDHFAWSQSRSATNQLVGLRYFNVYGPRESHKGRMASVAWHLTHQYAERAAVRLFQGSGGYADGEQRRDFVHVSDAVRANLFFFEHRDTSGIFNVGTGQSRSFNDVALAVINACRLVDGQASLDLADAVNQGFLSYFPMPDALKGKYQNFTEASMEKMWATGFESPCVDVPSGVGQYAQSIYRDLKLNGA